MPPPNYGDVIWTDDTALVDHYAVISRVHELVPRAQHRGDHLAVWWPPDQTDNTIHAAGQYLSTTPALRTMPDLP